MLKYLARICSFIVVAFLVLSLTPVPALANSPTQVQVNIPDKNLQKAIRLKIGKPSGAIYDTDMAKINEFTCSDAGIRDLTGLQYAVNLIDLRLNNNKISSLQPLSGLTKLSTLTVQNNNISSLAPLKNLVNLTQINAMINEITDLTPIIGLVRLTTLTLDANPLGSLPAQFSNLKLLDALWLDATSVKDLRPLSGLSSLTMLLLNCNEITDISPLRNLKKLVNLQLEFNHVTDLTPLEGLDSLRMLDLTYNKVIDCSSLGKLEHIYSLILKDNMISDISSFKTIKELHYLDLAGNQLSDDDVSSIKILKSLKFIDLEANKIVNLGGLRSDPFALPYFTGCNISSFYKKDGPTEDVTPSVFDPNNMDVEVKIHHIMETILNPEMTELEKTLAIHDYIIDNTDYSTDGIITGAYGVLLEHRAFCSTYTDTVQDLLNACGIENRDIGGAGHAWNMVRVDGSYYHLDSTWDDNGSPIYNYFLLSDKDIQAKRTGAPYDWTNIESALRWYKDEPCNSERFVPLANLLNSYMGEDRDKLALCGDSVYYIGSDGTIQKAPVDNVGNTEQLSTDACKSIMISGDRLIYQKTVDNLYYSMKTDGTGKAPVNWLFTTSSTPSQCANIFPVGGTIKITFNTNIKLVDTSLIGLTDSMGRKVPITLSAAGNVLSVKPKNKMLSYEEYDLTVPVNSVSGTNGYALKTAFHLYFSTAKNPSDLPEPKVSVIGGHYSTPIAVSIVGRTEAKIYYTTNNTCPTTLSSQYSKPISITKNTVLRYFVLDSYGNQSKVYTQIYFVECTYTVAFNSQGGSTVASKTASYNTAITAPSTPVLSGYVFSGWYKEAACTHAWNFATDKVTSSITLYAKWISIIPASVKAVSASYTSISISWDAVPNASGYVVCRATSETGTYTLAGTVTATSFLNTGLITGKTYYYKVRSYMLSGTTKVYSSYSAPVYASPKPATPTSLKVTRVSSTIVNLTWAPATGATNYEICRSSSYSGTYASVATTASAGYTNAGLISGRIYYYKVRAYRLEGSVKVYGDYSVIVKAVP